MLRPLPPEFDTRAIALLGEANVRRDHESLAAAASDALAIGHLPDLVVLPGNTSEVAAIVRLCAAEGVPIVVRGAGTGYTGGAVPVSGGVVLSMERFNRILEIDETNLLTIVQPCVITGDLQRAVEARGLFYPPDPASLGQSSIGGNVAECAGGPRAFKYGTTKRYVLALEAVIPTGEIVRTGSKAVKNVVGYDLTQLLVGSEGTLAVITEITLRLIPKPPARATVAAAFGSVTGACNAVTELIRRRAVPSAIELLDADSIRALLAYGGRIPGPDATEAFVIVECDGTPAAVEEEIALVGEACRAAGALLVTKAGTEIEREALWAARRQLSLALRATGKLKINHDVVVPRGRIPELIDAVDDLKQRFDLSIASFGHAGDGNLHVNIMVDRADDAARARARQAERQLFERVVALEGSISGEHGIGFAKAPYLDIELSGDAIALMKRVKAAFDPAGILNPGKIFPESL